MSFVYEYVEVIFFNVAFSYSVLFLLKSLQTNRQRSLTDPNYLAESETLQFSIVTCVP